jgi:ppGpp synthetase/RelA/SpoT-type nucleotidyltranferase
MPAWEGLLEEVRHFLENNRASYINVLSHLQAELAGIRHHPEVNGLIYSVYSRSDKQQGEPLKKEEKIAQKLFREREKRTCRVSDLDDIIGLTIVVNFPSDRDAVADYLHRDGVLSTFSIVERQLKMDKGYHAIHLTVRGETINYPDILAEVQIKTMLHDGWSAKTHDLTYKPRGALDTALLRHMQILGEVLRHLDDQSELIKNTILEDWNLDAKRREAARQILFRLLDSPGLDPELVALAKEIEGEKASLAVARVVDPRMKVINTKVRGLVDRIGYGRDICRFLTYFASLRAAGDINVLALNAVENWFGNCKTPSDKVGPLHFRSMTHYALGGFARAAEHAREALDFCQRNSLEREIIVAQGNLAYFLSELALGMTDSDPDLFEEAKKLSEAALEKAPDDLKPGMMDTRGAVLIACGCETEVRDGLALCKTAFDRASDAQKPVAEAFFRLHERRAFRRLLEWD